MTTRSIEASAPTPAVFAETRSETVASPHLQAQQLLNQFYSHPRLPEHGRGDGQTRQALQDFQRTRGLDPSGEPTSQTLEELGRAIAWQAHERTASVLASEADPVAAQSLSLPTSQRQMGVPPHLSHLAPESLTDVTFQAAERMTNDGLQRRAAGLSRRFDAEADPKVRRQ
mgnify:CR=1 FL=1